MEKKQRQLAECIASSLPNVVLPCFCLLPFCCFAVLPFCRSHFFRLKIAPLSLSYSFSCNPLWPILDDRELTDILHIIIKHQRLYFMMIPLSILHMTVSFQENLSKSLCFFAPFSIIMTSSVSNKFNWSQKQKWSTMINWFQKLTYLYVFLNIFIPVKNK